MQTANREVKVWLSQVTNHRLHATLQHDLAVYQNLLTPLLGDVYEPTT